MRRIKGLRLGAVAVLISLLAKNPAFGGEAIDLPSADQVSVVELVVTKPGTRTLVPVSEAELKKFGCVFSLNFDREKGGALISILSSNLTTAVNRDVGFNLRNAIYLKKIDGSVYKVLLGGFDSRVEAVDGRVSNGDGGGDLPVLADKKLFAMLGEWAKGLRGSSQAVGQCSAIWR